MSERRIESFNASDEQRWQAQERTLRALRDRTTSASSDERVPVDDAAIFDALSQSSMPAPPADFVAVMTAVSDNLRERHRQVLRFRRAVLAGLVLTYAAVAGIGLPISGGPALRDTALAIRHCLHAAPWLAAALVTAALVAAFGRGGDRQGDASH